MQVIPPPDPIATPSTLATWKLIRNRQYRLPEIDHSEHDQWVNRDRNLEKHLAAYKAEDIVELHAISLLIGLYGTYLCLMRAWEVAAFIGLLVLLNSLAAHYARRPVCPHRAARILCTVYFSSFRHPETRHVARRQLRLIIWPALLVAIFLAMQAYGAWGKPRPPMVNPRVFDRSGYWDYLRENNFFRDPPPPAPVRPP